MSTSREQIAKQWGETAIESLKIIIQDYCGDPTYEPTATEDEAIKKIAQAIDKIENALQLLKIHPT